MRYSPTQTVDLTSLPEFKIGRLTGLIGSPKVTIVPDNEPGYVLPDDLPLRPEFRAQFNAWAASFFKPKALIPDGKIVDYGSAGLAMNARTYRQLKAQEREQHAASRKTDLRRY